MTRVLRLQHVRVFQFYVRKVGSSEAWVVRFFLAKTWKEAKLAVRFQGKEWSREHPTAIDVAVWGGLKRLFLAIDQEMPAAWEEIEGWRAAGYRYCVKRPNFPLMPMLGNSYHDVRPTMDEPGVVVYNLATSQTSDLAVILRAYERAKRVLPPQE